MAKIKSLTPAHNSDCIWASEALQKGQFDTLQGDFIAIYQKEIVGSSDDIVALRIAAATKLNIDPEMIVIVHRSKD